VNAIERELKRALDPAALAPAIGMVPDPWQADVLRSGHPRILLNCCRQAGKSQTAAILAVHAAVYEPGSLVLLVSRSQRQSSELFKVALVDADLRKPTIPKIMGFEGQGGVTEVVAGLKSLEEVAVHVPISDSGNVGHAQNLDALVRAFPDHRFVRLVDSQPARIVATAAARSGMLDPWCS